MIWDLLARAFDALRGPAITADGWYRDAARIATHPGWFGGTLQGGKPGGVVCHVTDTGTTLGTAANMARNRARPFVRGKDRLSSWHATVEADGSVVQMIPFTRVAWHAGSDTAVPIKGLGWANYTTVGIELVGRTPGPFPQAQVDGYARLLRALVTAYGIPREHAMIAHSALDPHRRHDPGPEWMNKHAPRVLDYVYATTTGAP